MTHNFEERLGVGEKYEKDLDAFFEPFFEVQPVQMNMQKLGVDRIFTHRKNGQRYSIEYKTDIRCKDTGNLYIETISVDKDNKLGWAYTSTAQRIIFHIPGDKVIFVDTLNLRDIMPKWVDKYPQAEAKNELYSGFGILVPVMVVAKIAKGTMGMKHG